MKNCSTGSRDGERTKILTGCKAGFRALKPEREKSMVQPLLLLHGADKFTVPWATVWYRQFYEGRNRAEKRNTLSLVPFWTLRYCVQRRRPSCININPLQSYTELDFMIYFVWFFLFLVPTQTYYLWHLSIEIHSFAFAISPFVNRTFLRSFLLQLAKD